MREFVVELGDAHTYDAFVAAFNAGFVRPAGGEWSGRSWDAFHDYLSWPDEERFRLVLRGWDGCGGLNAADRRMVQEIMADNPHVQVVYAEPFSWPPRQVKTKE